MGARTCARRGRDRAWTLSFPVLWIPATELCTFLFSLSQLFFFLSFLRPLLRSTHSRRQWHFTKERRREERDARAKGAERREARGEIYYGARRGGRSYFKTRRGSCLAHGARVRVGTYGDDLVDGRRYGRQMYCVCLNSMRGRPRSAAQNGTETRRRLRDNWPRSYMFLHKTRLV